ncbi:MAG: helix-hairpin-helix domain-containing protein [Bacteroidia bacterium]
MTNSDIAEILSAYAKLSELHGENPFKIKSYQAAAFAIDKILEPLCGKNLHELESYQGIGKSIAKVVYECCSFNSFPELEALISKTPKGVLDIMKIKGLGPKKVAFIWKNLGIESIGELLYACKENRLAQAKGFGLKTQQNVLLQIEFMQANAGKFHYYKAAALANRLVKILKDKINAKIEITGQIRRKCEVVDDIEILIGLINKELIHHVLQQIDIITEILVNEFFINATAENIPVKIYWVEPNEFAYKLMLTTGNDEHLKFIGFNESCKNFENENEIFYKLGTTFFEPELREGLFEKEVGNIPLQLITFSDLKGALHNHSTWSDGTASIEDMALFCIQLGWQYFGIADHSKAAFYANGLSEERILAQQKEIDVLNKKLMPFKIFKGIECDILNDGTLDYSNEILKTFDYVVASVHSNLKMDETKAMNRLIKAIENPFTTVLGHATGRLLLVREGYPINHKKIIDACAANGVSIELNANPYRLDLDWRYIPYALNKGVKICINPDAHEPDGLLDMQWGVAVARKGLLTPKDCLNAMNVEELDIYFKSKK